MFGAPFASVNPFGARLFAGTMAQSVQEICALIFCTLLLYYAPAGSNMLDLCKNGYTKPLGDIKLEYGKVPLIITCVITSASKIAANPNISNIMFYTKAGAEVQNMTRILNNTTIELYDDHPLKSNVLYTCKLRGSGKGKDESICWNDVSIGVKPYNVSDFKCISNNFENLTCTWTPLNTFVDTIYELTFHYGAKNMVINKCPKLEYPSEYQPESKQIRCVLDLTTDPQYRMVLPIYYFNLRMYNDFGEYINPTYEFHHFKNVRSGPPERLEAINTTTSSIYLNWSIPNSMVTFPKALQYRVVYQCEYGPKKWLPGGENNGTITVHKHDAVYYYNLTGLAYAHALCDIRVAIRSAEARDDESMWSTHASITVRTSSRLPGAPPNTTIGSFEISFSEIETVTDITRNEVYIYWQQIGDDIKNGEEFDYETVLLDNDFQQHGRHGPIERKEKSNAYAKYGNLVLSKTYRFAVYSVNSQGWSVRRSEIVVPAQALRPKEPGSFTKVSYGNGKYELKWEPAAHDEGINRPALTSYTLFWCSNDRDRPYQCTGHLDWIHLPANVTSYQLTVVENKQVTQFAITANTGNTSSGMLWASCTILHDKYVGKIRDFWIYNMGSTHIEVGWKLACSERIGNVIGYTIFYCPIISPKETDCKGDMQIQSIEGDENLIHGRITGLIPYSTYMLRIAVVTAVMTGSSTAAAPPIGTGSTITPGPSNKTSQLSDALYNTTLEAAPTPPLHLTVLNVTNASIAFIWDAPLHSNGVLKYYKVMYNGKTDEVGPGTEKTKKTFELKSLQSFVTYNITVSACTTFCSKPSDMVHVTTKIGLPGTISSIDTRFQNDSYVLVNWPQPNPPRGRCDYYQLNIKHEIDYKNETLPITNVTERKYAVTRCGDNNRYNTFYMSVRAVNLINYDVLPGPWSDEIKFFCKAPPSSIFWLVFSSVMAVFVALLLWLSRRCYYHYRDMRNVEVKLPPGLATAAISESNLPSWSGGNQGKGNLNSNLTSINSAHRCDSAHIPMHYQHNVFGSKDKDHHHHQSNQQQIVKSDEELVLLKMNSHESDRLSNGDSSGCSTGHDSATSSLEGSAVDGRDDDEIDIDVDMEENAYDEGNEELNRRNTDRCSSDSGTDQANSNSTNSLNKTNSLRLRKPIPTGSIATAATVTSGYITVPPDLSTVDAQSAGKTTPLWSIVTKPTSPSGNVNSYCMLGIDPAAATPAPLDITIKQQQSAGAPTSAYVTFDSQQQPQTNRGTTSPDQQQQVVPVVLSRPTPIILQQGIKNAASTVSGSGYIPLMYGDPSDTENDLATTPPASHAHLSQPPNYVLASAKQQTPTSIPIQIATLMKPQPPQLQQQDFMPSLIAVNTANVTNDKVVVHKSSIDKPPPYVQAAPMPKSKLHPTVAMQSITIDCQTGQNNTTSPGYVSVADVNPPTKRQDCQQQPSQQNSAMGYIMHRQLSKHD